MDLTAAQQQSVSDKSCGYGNEWRQALAYGGLGLIIALLALWPTLTHMASVLLSSDDYRYGWFVLPVQIYILGWFYRDEFRQLVPQPEFRGLGLVGFAICLWLCSAIVDISLGKHLALVLIVLGVILCTVGWRIFQRRFAVFALLFFLIPCGDLLEPALRDITVKMVEWFAVISGLPLHVDGYTLYVGNLRYVIVPACSGMGYVTMAAFIAYCLGSLRYRHLGQLSLCALLGAALGILVNGVRVNAILWFDWVNGTQMELAQHQDFHRAVLIALLGLFILVAARIEIPVATSAEKLVGMPGQSSVVGTNRLAPVIAGILVLLTLAPLQLFARHGPEDSGNFAADLKPLTVETLPLLTAPSSWNIAEGGRFAVLTLELDGNVQVQVQRLLPGSGKLGSALLPQNEEGWREAKSEYVTGCTKQRCIKFVHTGWTKRQVEEVRHLFFAYFVGNTVTDSELLFRLATGWNRLLGRQFNAGLIAFSSHGDAPSSDALAAWFLLLMSAS